MNDLRLPFAGYRGRGNGSMYDQGILGCYWSSSPGGGAAYLLYFNSLNILSQNGNYRAYGYSVRCFKN
jgi:hypothetical protein